LKTTERVLGIVAALILLTQTVRHAYVRWIEPRASVLDRYDRPLGDRISAATSLEELLKLYDPVKREADGLKATAVRNREPYNEERDNTEPFRSERELRQAIQSWEEKAKEVRALWFYWTVGFLVLCLGFALRRLANRWAGLTLEIVAFSEFIYWTSPSFFGANVREFDRLLTLKFVLSIVSVILLLGVIRIQEIFADGQHRDLHAA
jgi:hypothetical protein